MIKLSKSVLAKAVAVACAAGMLSACSASAQKTATIDDSQLYVRQAAGDLTKFAGARRIQDNQTELYSNVLDLAKKEHARNVILLWLFQGLRCLTFHWPIHSLLLRS